MIHKINNQESLLSQITKQNDHTKADDTNFKETLTDFLKDVNELQKESKNITESFVEGEVTDLHQVTIAAEKARLSFELLLEIRNKTLESYQELMRMQV